MPEVFLRTCVEWDDYYSRIKGVYDGIADEYDATVGAHAVSRRAKQSALQIIEEHTPNHGRLLDIGCYTGEEAVRLARRGYEVIGTDLSSRMVELARAKARKWNVTDRIRFEALPASKLDALNNGFQGAVDTAYSVYGALNLEPRLEPFKHTLHLFLRPNGVFVCGLLNPTVLYELLVAPLLLQFHGYRKLPKSGVPMRTGLGNRRVPAYLYTPQEFAVLMEPEFSLVDALGVHFLYPPPRGESEKTDRWWLARALDTWEHRLQRRFPFRNLGFFSLLVFRREGGS